MNDADLRSDPLRCGECGSDEVEIILIAPAVDGAGGRPAIDYVERGGALPVDCFDCDARTWRNPARLASALRESVRDRLPPDCMFGRDAQGGTETDSDAE